MTLVSLHTEQVSWGGNGVMDKEEFSEYTNAQLDEIRKHKWIESERAGRDLGQECCLEWIRLYAADFRKWWEKTHPKKSKKEA